MKILDLTNTKTSEIDYKKISFPDGQQQITIDPNFHAEVLIKARLNNFLDLELIICTTKALNNIGINTVNLYVPYFLGSRSDRRFEEGSTNYLKDIICPIINGLNFKSVQVVDPHSDVLEACLNNFVKFDNSHFIKWAIEYASQSGLSEKPLKDFILISPDAGANKKIYHVAEKIHYKGPIITCGKIRNIDGKITHTDVPLQIERYNNYDFVIIDDICDGGRTFIEISKEIRKLYPDKDNKIYLMITHGIFSNGFFELSKYIDKIYCTNSYYSKISDLTNSNLVKQYNIF